MAQSDSKLLKEPVEKQEAKSYLCLGDGHRSNNEFEIAIEDYKKALENARERQNIIDEKDAHIGLGQAYCFNSQFEKAIEHFDKALEIAKEHGDESEKTETLLQLGFAYGANNQFDAAIENFEKALKIAKDNEYKRHETMTFLWLGDAHRGKTQFQKAIRYFNKALKIAIKHENKYQETEALLGLGGAYRGNNQFQIAVEYSNKALKIAIKHGDKYQETEALLGLGDVYRGTNQFPKAIQYIEEALEIAKEHDYKQLKVRALLGLGDANRSNNKFETAVGKLEEGLKVAQEHNYKQQETGAFVGLGRCYRVNGEFEKAIGFFDDALEIAKQHGDKYQETEALLGLGDAYRVNSDFPEAVVQFGRALEMAEANGYKQLQTTALIGFGRVYCVYEWNCEFLKATEYSKKALAIAKEHNDEQQEISALLVLGHVNISREMGKDAIKCCKKSLKIATRRNYTQRKQEALLWLRDAYKSNKQYQKAFRCSQKALRVGEFLEDASPGSIDTHDDSNRNPQTLNTPDVTQVLDSQPENGDENEGSDETSSAVQESVSGCSHQNEESLKGWEWIESSIVHREKLLKLQEYGKKHPEEIKEVNGVRFCYSHEFVIGKGSDGTRVYVGLGKDGYERAVKRLPRDFCARLAEQEKKVLNEAQSKYVVRYWFSDHKSDKDWLFLILDLCEETLVNFVNRSSLEDLAKNAPSIMQHVLEGLADLHRDPNPILHRDLKPSNILRDVKGNWLLADFGISRILTAGDSSHSSGQRGTDDWRAVESYPRKDMSDDGIVRYKKESDIQVAGMVAFYIVTKGEHPFGEKPDRLRNLLDGNPVGLGTLKDPALQDLLSWKLSHDPQDRPSAEEALKHPYLQSKKQQFEMLCKVGNQPEIKTCDVKSDVVRKLNSDPKDWRSLVKPDVLSYLSTDSSKGWTFSYPSSWSHCLRLIRNVKEHWHDRPRPRPEIFYVVGDPQEYFLTLFPDLPVRVHRIVRSCDWKERPDLNQYFI